MSSTQGSGQRRGIGSLIVLWAVAAVTITILILTGLDVAGAYATTGGRFAVVSLVGIGVGGIAAISLGWTLIVFLGDVPPEAQKRLNRIKSLYTWALILGFIAVIAFALFK